MKKIVCVYFMVDDLLYLQWGGCLSSVQVFIGGLLKVKFIFYFDNKLIVFFEKIWICKKVIFRILELFVEDVSKGILMWVVVIYVNREEEAVEII